mgnify:CR=1 FL=1
MNWILLLFELLPLLLEFIRKLFRQDGMKLTAGQKMRHFRQQMNRLLKE